MLRVAHNKLSGMSGPLKNAQEVPKKSPLMESESSRWKMGATGSEILAGKGFFLVNSRRGNGK